MKTKIKSHNNLITKNFRNDFNGNNEIPKDRVVCICLSAILVNSAFNSGKHYSPQALLEECEYKIEKER